MEEVEEDEGEGEAGLGLMRSVLVSTPSSSVVTHNSILKGFFVASDLGEDFLGS